MYHLFEKTSTKQAVFLPLNVMVCGYCIWHSLRPFCHQEGNQPRDEVNTQWRAQVRKSWRNRPRVTGINYSSGFIIQQIFFLLFSFLIFWHCRMACRTLVPQSGVEPAPPAVEGRSFNHWTPREVPDRLTFNLVWQRCIICN